MSTLSLELLRSLVAGDGVAVRVRQRLQPAGGEGDKVFPPTFATGEKALRYAMETRRIDGKEIPAVLLDSTASQANRMEEALQAAWDRGDLTFPVIGVDFSGDPELADLGRLTTLQAPHRIADAILRDAVDEHGRTLFRDLPEGKAFTDATFRDASAVYTLCPTALVFGVWDSTGPKGGMGAKFQRALSSEIVGIGVHTGRKVSSRIDPLAIGSGVPVYQHKDLHDDWTIDETEARKQSGKPVAFSRKGTDGKGKPSAINHSNIAPSIDELSGGVTIDYAVQTVVLSLAALRRLRFVTAGISGVLGSRADAEAAARTALAALGLAAIVHQRAQGFDLRSRCLFVPDGPLQLEVVHHDGRLSPVELDIPSVNALLADAASAAAAAGLPWTREPLRLRPAPKLSALIKRSRALAAAGSGDTDE